MLQISQSEPAVRHAVLAVSSLHEGLTSAPCAGDTTQSFTLQQYNKAIACLLDQMKKHTAKPLASLLTCVLFVCIEFLQGKYKESLIHLEQGQQLLIRLDQRPNNPEMECIVRYIVPLYTRLSLASFLFGVGSVPVPDFLRSRSEIPDTFETIDDLRAAMHAFMGQAFQFTQQAQPAKNSSDSIPRETMQMLEVEQDRLLSRLAKLNVAFSLFRASVGSKPGPNNALLVLQMYLHAQHIWISTVLSSSEVVYDDYLSSFAAIVPLAAVYLDLEASSQHQLSLAPPTEPSQYSPEIGQQVDGQTGSFTLETRIVPPLYYVATKCRHPLIRRSALNLLRRSPFRRESLWRASVMGSLSGHIISLEETWAQWQSRPVTPVPRYSLHGSYMSLGGVYHVTQLSGTALSYDVGQDDSSRDILSLQNVTMPIEETTAGVPIKATVSSLPELTFEDFDVDQPMERAIDPALHIGFNSSLSQVPSLTPSIDGCSSSSAMGLTMSTLSPTSNDTSVWQQEQQQEQGCRHHGTYQPASTTDYLREGFYNHAQRHAQKIVHLSDQPGAMGDYVSHPNSDGWSPDAYHQYYQTTTGGHAYQQYQHKTATLPTPSVPQQHEHLARNHLPKSLNTEAPFGLPEELRVHDATLGSEREDGSWVTVFRKLHGVDANRDTHTDRAPTD